MRNESFDKRTDPLGVPLPAEGAELFVYEGRTILPAVEVDNKRWEELLVADSRVPTLAEEYSRCVAMSTPPEAVETEEPEETSREWFRRIMGGRG